MIGHLDINSLRSKCEMLSCTINNKLDLLMVGETKLDDFLSTSQYLIEGYSIPFRLDRNNNEGRIT